MPAAKSNKTPCPKCGNPLRLGGIQPGEEVRCPKCNATFAIGDPKQDQPLVPPPPKVVAVNPLDARQGGELPIAKSASPAAGNDADDDAYEPEIPLIPSVIGVPVDVVDARLGETAEFRRPADDAGDQPLEVERQSGSGKDHAELHLESARRRGLLRHYRHPDPPRHLFFSGVFGFPWRGMNVGRWAIMSVFLSVAAVLDVQALEMLGLLGGDLSRVALPGLLMAVFGIGATLFAGMYVTPVLQTAIQDTADGHDLPQDGTFPDWDQWVFTLLGWVSLGAGAAAIGYPLSLFVGPAAMLGSSFILFPVLLLSAMESGSYLVPLSPPVLATLRSHAGYWIGFYLVSGVLLVATGAAMMAGALSAPTLIWLFGGPLLASVGLIYARLLGRLAWKASGAKVAPIEVDTAEEADQSVSVAAVGKGSSRGKRSRVKIVVPDETEQPDTPDERPRVSFHHRP